MKYVLALVSVMMIVFLILSCGEKISRPQETRFESAAVYIDDAVLWGINPNTQNYEQLISNGDMETWVEETVDSTTYYELSDWELSSDSLFANREEAIVNGGDYSAQLYWISESDLTIKSDPIPVDDEMTYTCSIYVYDNDEGGQAQLMYYWDNDTPSGAAISANSSEWQLLTASITPPSGAQSVQIGIKLQDVLAGLSDTTFIQLNPPWDDDNGYSFLNPGNMLIGLDTYLYVCDTGNNRIVRLDAAGTIHDTYDVPHPTGISQNEVLHLLVVNGTSDIYKIDVGPGGDGEPVICFTADNPTADSMITDNFIFTDISDMPTDDKTYLACGYDSLLDGTGQVYMFFGFADLEYDSDYMVASEFAIAGADPNVPDTAHNPIVDYGTGVSYTDHPNGITAFLKSDGLFLLSTQDSSSFKTQLLSWYINSYYHVQYFQAAITPGPEVDLYLDENLDIRPNAATVDPSGNIYIVCSPDTVSGDSLCAYKFGPGGDFLESWGVLGDSTMVSEGYMNHPRGIAYDYFADRRTVYISDSGNNRILRFKLSTDIED